MFMPTSHIQLTLITLVGGVARQHCLFLSFPLFIYFHFTFLLSCVDIELEMAKVAWMFLALEVVKVCDELQQLVIEKLSIKQEGSSSADHHAHH